MRFSKVLVNLLSVSMNVPTEFSLLPVSNNLILALISFKILIQILVLSDQYFKYSFMHFYYEDLYQQLGYNSVVELLDSKHEALNLTFSTTKKEKKKMHVDTL